GITGTDGKTTTSILTHEALLAAGARAGAMTSLDFRCLDQIEGNPTYRTTLEAPEIQRQMRRLADAGVETAVLETTSHGIALGRVAGVAYDVAAYTNLTHEHLDFHGSLEEYRRVKLRLAAMAAAAPRRPGVPKAVVFNADDPAWAPLADAAVDVLVTYGLEGAAGVPAVGGPRRGGPAAHILAVDLRPRIGGIDFAAQVGDQRLPVSLPLTGRFNVRNALCALAVCHALGLPLDRAAAGLRAPRGLRGRMQVIDRGQPFAVVVDYAHTPDGLEQVLGELRPLTPGRLLAIFGAPGDRDATKRPLMGDVVGRLADEFWITTDDPRQESVADISAAIAAGAVAAGRAEGADFRRVPDRREAIRAVLRRAAPGDTVLLAGKGAEDRMLIGAEALPWDEAAEAAAALVELGW
ncbi:MAG TPA: UDP-N-acetylmuramoyl-L-alanyl-D-glutamate--2,6-diaminopimelate ligase, partial [Candidatus Dormibacteraeota bacterium]|nr:UDP-N-acetylmuramoyl-L-alanyl-D-glutamate--2,6-diaminopimelate ligase [Candidatus Dormibacteraeota bacterium]